jgi:hypothetical protein
MATNKEMRNKLEELQLLVVEALIQELKEGNTANISVANTLLATNKVVTQPETEESMHEKIRKATKK